MSIAIVFVYGCQVPIKTINKLLLGFAEISILRLCPVVLSLSDCEGSEIFCGLSPMHVSEIEKERREE
jgi:hypothetical protein